MTAATAHALVIGESLVDVVTDAAGVSLERPGGSAANVAVALARLGRPVRFATAYADDDRGRVVAEHLRAAGVEPAGDPHVVARTSTARAAVGADGAATYTFDLDWRLGDLDLGGGSAEQPAFVHVCSFGAVLAPGADDVLAVLDGLDRREGSGGPTVTYDVNARPALTGHGPEVRGRVESVARRAHVVKASDEDLAVLYPTLSMREAAEHLRSLGPRAVVVTCGGAGATWYGADSEVSAPAQPVEVVDTIGAGDTFAAALIDGLWEGLAPVDLLAQAVRAAAVTVSRPGADPPSRDELG